LIPELVTHNQLAKEFWLTFEDTSGYLKPERVNKWPISMTDIYMMMMTTCFTQSNLSIVCIYIRP
jgi:hypothetical protein